MVSSQASRKVYLTPWCMNEQEIDEHVHCR